MIKKNTVLLNEVIVGLSTDKELHSELDKLAKHYQVETSEFTVAKVNPYSFM